MTDDEVRVVARATARELMISMGLNPDDVIGNQKDAAFVRSWRESTAEIRRTGLMTAVGVIVVGSLGLLWLAIRGGSP